MSRAKTASLLQEFAPPPSPPHPVTEAVTECGETGGTTAADSDAGVGQGSNTAEERGSPNQLPSRPASRQSHRSHGSGLDEGGGVNDACSRSRSCSPKRSLSPGGRNGGSKGISRLEASEDMQKRRQAMLKKKQVFVRMLCLCVQLFVCVLCMCVNGCAPPSRRHS